MLQGDVVMKLYKYISSKYAYEYLRTGCVEAESFDDEYGIVSFSKRSWVEAKHNDKDFIVLEFEIHDISAFQYKNCLNDSDVVMRIELSKCRMVDGSFFYVLEPEFKLDSFTVGPDSQLRWRYIRSSLKKIGKKDTAIKMLKKYEMQEALYVDEEYREYEQGLYRFTYNLQHPSIRDQELVAEVD